MLIKHWNGTYWQSLDFTMANLQSLVDSVYLSNAHQAQFHQFAMPQFSLERMQFLFMWFFGLSFCLHFKKLHTSAYTWCSTDRGRRGVRWR